MQAIYICTSMGMPTCWVALAPVKEGGNNEGTRPCCRCCYATLLHAGQNMQRKIMLLLRRLQNLPAPHGVWADVAALRLHHADAPLSSQRGLAQSSEEPRIFHLNARQAVGGDRSVQEHQRTHTTNTSPTRVHAYAHTYVDAHATRFFCPPHWLSMYFFPSFLMYLAFCKQTAWGAAASVCLDAATATTSTPAATATAAWPPAGPAWARAWAPAGRRTTQRS